MSDSTFALQAQTALSNGQALPKVGHRLDPAQARRVAQDYESVFLSQVLKPMFNNTDAAAPFGGGFAEDMWRSMEVDEYGKAVARAGGIGIADAIYRQILKTQEVHKP